MLIEIKIIIKSDKISTVKGDPGGEWNKLWWDVIVYVVQWLQIEPPTTGPL